MFLGQQHSGMTPPGSLLTLMAHRLRKERAVEWFSLRTPYSPKATFWEIKPSPWTALLLNPCLPGIIGVVMLILVCKADYISKLEQEAISICDVSFLLRPTGPSVPEGEETFKSNVADSLRNCLWVIASSGSWNCLNVIKGILEPCFRLFLWTTQRLPR